MYGIRTITTIFIILLCLSRLAAQFGGGSGTEQDPWHIATAEHLDYIRNFLGEDHADKHYIQTADIDLGVPPWNEGEGWEPIGTFQDMFHGNYNGNYYRIERLFIDNPVSASLFGYIAEAEITDLFLEDVSITGYYHVGALASGTSSNSSISGVSVTGFISGYLYVGGLIGAVSHTTITDVSCNVYVTGESEIGGLAGYIQYSIVENSYSKGSVYGSSLFEFSAGGLIGSCLDYSTISNSYSTSNVSGYSHVGGFVGTLYSGTIQNCFSTGEVIGSNLVGGFIGHSFTAAYNCYWDVETSGIVVSATGEGRTTSQMLSAQTFAGWDFNNTWNIIEGFSYPALQHQELSSYPLPGPSNLSVSYSDQTVFLDWDLPYNTPSGYRVYRDGILLNEDQLITIPEYTDTNTLPFKEYIYYVTAVFDDDGTLIESANSNYGFVLTVEFPGGDGSEDDPYLVETGGHLSAVRFFLDAHFLQIADIDLNVPPWNEGEGWEPIKKGFDRFSGSYDGGGHTISGLYINRPEDLNQGLWSEIIGGEVCNLQLIDIDVTGRGLTGGLAGNIRNNSIITNVTVKGSIQGSDFAIGGLTGALDNSHIEDSYSVIEIIASDNYVGGLAGKITESDIINCYTDGSIFNTGGWTGGLIGTAEDSGIIGSSSSMDVTSAAESTGGLLGESDNTTIQDCYSNGNVLGIRRVGGLVGYALNSTIGCSYSTSRVRGSHYSVGGLVGGNRSTHIDDCYSAGSVFSTHSWVGGLIGSNSGGEINNCYSVSYVTGWGNNIGGLIGFGEHQNITNSYWNIETSGLTESSGGEGLTTAGMLQAATYSEWDFNDIWILEENITYPALIWQDPSTCPVPGPTNLTGYGCDEAIHLFWEEPFNEPLGYNIYRDGILLNEGFLITDTEYIDQDVSNWEFHTYYITAVFSVATGQIESLRSDYLEVSSVLFAGGNGSIDSPYLIETAHQLANVRYAPASHFVQVADINLALPPWNEGEGWVPIGTSFTDSFIGSYDGNGYSILFLYINRPDEERQGLFGSVRFAVLKNITLFQADIAAAGFAGTLAGGVSRSRVVNCSSSGGVTASGNFAGGLAGYASFSLMIDCYSNCLVNGGNSVGGLLGQSVLSVVDNCYTEGSVSGHYSTGGLIGTARAYSYTNNSHSSSTVAGSNNVGVLIGSNNRSILINSYSNGVVTGTGDSTGGLVGLNQDSIIHNCYSRSTVSGYRYVGGLVGYNNIISQKAVVEYGYSTGPVSGSIAVGGLVGVSDPGSLIRYSYWNTETSGTAFSAGGEGRSTEDMTYPYNVNTFSGWDFSYAWAEDQNHDINEGYPYLDFNADLLFVGGTGTEADPFLIDRSANLRNLRYFLGSTNSDKHFKLIADIGFTASSRNVSEEWVSLGTSQVNSFHGHFDGNGHTITGLYINQPGLDYQGLFGYTQEALIKNVGIVNANVTGANDVGILIGRARQTNVKNCFTTGVVNATNSVGGLVGRTSFNTQIEASYNRTNVTASRYAGGIVGYNHGSTVSNCFNTGSINGINVLGGLVGGSYSNSVIEKSFSIGAVNGLEQQVGGLTGSVSNSVVNYSYWNTETSGLEVSAGGEGRTTAEMTYPYADNTYVSWDFEQIWMADPDYSLNNGYPYLGETTVSADLPITQLKTEMIIYPNPFNPDTTIRLINPQEKPDELVIYNIKGQKVRGTRELEEDANGYLFVWDGRNDYNKMVASGVYFVIIRAEGKQLAASKMLLLK